MAEAASASTRPHGAPPARTVVLLQTHYLNKSLLRRFATLTQSLAGHEAKILMHRPPGTPKPALLENVPHHFVTTPEIRNPAYPAKSGGPNWGIWRGGHTDLIALHFFNAHPNYDRYWFLEYDVRFSGSWPRFFLYFAESDADFLGTTIRRATTQPEWMHWPTLSVPDSAGPVGQADRICSFMPIMRASRRALAAIDAAYRAGWGGHCEVTWPTIVARAGLKIEDFGGDGEFVRPENRNRFYTNTPSDRDLAPGSMVFRPARTSAGFRRNRLWHPVKPLPAKLKEDARHAWVMVKPYLPWLRLGDGRREAASGARRVSGCPEPAMQGPSRKSP